MLFSIYESIASSLIKSVDEEGLLMPSLQDFFDFLVVEQVISLCRVRRVSPHKFLEDLLYLLWDSFLILSGYSSAKTNTIGYALMCYRAPKALWHWNKVE